jgi:membrane associated rhomboid family serine protease
MFSLPPVTQALIVANVVAFLAELSLGDAIVAPFALWPLGTPQFMPWQVISYAFLHSGWTHLLFNMLGLYMFGADVERVWGGRRILVYYLTCALSAAVAQLVTSSVTGAFYPTIGASGAVFGLLLAFAILFPYRVVMPLFPPIPMRAPVFAGVYGALELLLGVTGTQEGVAHFAHLGGMAGGYLVIRYWKRWR